jgi:hypothetical protein
MGGDAACYSTTEIAIIVSYLAVDAAPRRSWHHGKDDVLVDLLQ